MPRTNFSRRKDQLRDLVELVDRYRRIEDINKEELAKRLGCSAMTLRSRLKFDPERFTIGQLWDLAGILHIPEDEINKALCAGTKKRY